MDKFLPDGVTIKNGFKACGLYPWKPDSVDYYTKCLGANKKIHNSSDDVVPPNTKITFKAFADVVGKELFSKLEAWLTDESETFATLYKVLQVFKKEATEENIPIMDIEGDQYDTNKMFKQLILKERSIFLTIFQ